MMTEQEREEVRQFNGRMIEELCEIGEKIVDLYAADIRKQSQERLVAGVPKSQWDVMERQRDYHE